MSDKNESEIRDIVEEAGSVDGRLAILVTRWNSFITDNLLKGAINSLQRNGLKNDQIDVVRLPGAFELPMVAKRVAATGNYEAIIALGCVIRGGTPHFEYVSGECTAGLGQVQRDADVPITFGILTVDNVDQAIERSGEGPNNKGEEAALTALEMVRLLQKIG